jgi:pimeloyl-ACP methyl ester carboxylesterase
MAAHLDALARMGTAALTIETLRDLPIAVISAADQPPEIIAKQRALASLSSRGRHVVAALSGHWIHLDEPDLVVNAVREIADDARARTSSG